MDQTQLSPEELQDLINDPRMKDPAIRAQALGKLDPDQQTFVSSKFGSDPTAPAKPTPQSPTAGSSIYKAAGGIAGMALPGLISTVAPEIGIPMWLMEAIGGGLGSLAGGQATGSDSPMADMAAGGAPALLGPALGLAGRFVGSKAGGPLAGMAAGTALGHPWLGASAGRLAGKEIGAGLETAGGAIESAMPGSLLKRALSVGGKAAGDLSAPGMSAADIAGLKAAGYSDDVIARMGNAPAGAPPAQGAKSGSGSVLRAPKGAPIPTGRPGSGLSPGEEAGIQGLDELFSRTGNESPNPMGHGNYKDGGSGTLGGPDTAGLRSQPNVNLRRTTADVKEQVSRGVNGDNMWQDPRSISVDYGNTPDNARSVEAIQAEIKAKLDAADAARKTKLRKPK